MNQPRGRVVAGLQTMAATPVMAIKPAVQRQKRAPAKAENERKANGKPRSASASEAVAPTCSDSIPEQRRRSKQDSTASTVAPAASAHQCPPRSPAMQPKATCVPTLEDALVDVQVRFVLNLPEAELQSADRLFFQLEQGWWFYEDLIADAHKHLPHFKLKEFSKLMFEHCDALRPLSGKYNELFEYFRSWKGTIPTAGCILLNPAMTKVVLVKSWKGNSRGFPKGKINQGEPAIAAAVREVMEETGFDASEGANEKDSFTLYLNDQQMTMFIVTGVDESFAFEPQVRKEVSAVEWFPLDALPNRCYGVEPCISRLRRWMAKSKGMRAPKNATADARTQSLIRLRKTRATSPEVSSAVAAVASIQSQPASPTSSALRNGAPSSKKQGRKGNKGACSKDAGGANGEGGRANSAPSRRVHAKGYDAHNRDTFGGGQDQADGDGQGWDFEAMLEANARLTGRTFVYDGNPHEFGDPAQASRLTPEIRAPAAAHVECSHMNVPSRAEDQVGHLKQRVSNVQHSSATTGGLHAGPSKPQKEGGNGGRGATSSNTDERRKSGRGRSSGKAKSGSNAISKVSDACVSGAKAPVMSPNAPDRLEHSQDRIVERHVGVATRRSAGKCRPRAVDGLCTEEVTSGEGMARAAAVWGRTPGATATEGAGLFGDFKFDLLDIMSAVPTG